MIMKTLLKIFFLMAVISLVAGCNKTDEFFDDAQLELKNAPIVNHAEGLDQERFVTMKELDLTIHYRIIGKGPIDMVFIPGWTNPLTVYTKQFDYFRDKARCIYVDLPGQGISDAPSPATPVNPVATGPQYTMELMAEAVYRIVKKEGLHHFVAVGFSMGPTVWSMFERNYPGMINKLVAIDGNINPWLSDPTAWQARYDQREADYLAQLGWTAATKQMLAGYLVPPGSPDDLLEWVKYFQEFPSDILANINYYANAENANELVDWTVPILCFYSNPNPNMNKVNLIYPNNTTYTYPGGGHVIQWVFQEEINLKIWDFIKDRPGKKY
jgi:pimeloyl-ACP methyl ester carboxylesterase